MDFRRLAILCSVILGAVFICVTSFSGTSYALSAGIGSQPGLPRADEPRSKSIFIHTIDKGQSIAEKIRVANNSDKTKKIAIYPVDAITTNTGSFTCKQKVEKNEDAGDWLTFTKSEITLEKGQSEMLDFTITAPRSTDVGEHNACIALEEVNDQGEVSGNLRIRTRSAIRVSLTIPGQLSRALSVGWYHVTQDGYAQIYAIQLKNRGNVSADTQINVRLKTLYGMTVYENGGEYPVMAGKDMELTYKNDKSPFFGGWYYAEASAAYDKRPEKYGVRDKSQLVTLQPDSTIIFINPQPAAVLIMATALMGTSAWIFTMLKKRRAVKTALRDWRMYAVEHGDSIEELAGSYGMHWKKIAKINKLKPPYALKKGQQILVPQEVEDDPEGIGQDDID